MKPAYQILPTSFVVNVVFSFTQVPPYFHLNSRDEFDSKLDDVINDVQNIADDFDKRLDDLLEDIRNDIMLLNKHCLFKSNNYRYRQISLRIVSHRAVPSKSSNVGLI